MTINDAYLSMTLVSLLISVLSATKKEIISLIKYIQKKVKGSYTQIKPVSLICFSSSIYRKGSHISR